MNGYKYIIIAIGLAVALSTVALYKAHQTNLMGGFDDTENFEIQDLPLNLAVYLIDKKLTLIAATNELQNQRLELVSELQKIIIAEQEKQTTLNIRTEERLTAEEEKD